MDYFKKETNIYFSSEVQLPHPFLAICKKRQKGSVKASFQPVLLNKMVTGS